MPELLELAHLVDEHGVAEVQVRGRRVEAGLDPQRLAARELLQKVRLGQEFGGAAAQFLELSVPAPASIPLAGTRAAGRNSARVL